MAFTVLGALAATLKWGRFLPAEQDAAFQRAEAGWLERSRQSLPPVREHPFEKGIPFILRPGLIAAILVVATAIGLSIWFW